MPDRGGRGLDGLAGQTRAPPQADTSFRIGPYAVRTDADAVAAFAAALGMRRNGGSVPLTFPIRWLCLPHVHAAIAEGLGVQHSLLVQRSQSFDYRIPLERNHDYRLTIEGRRDRSPGGSIVLRTRVADASDRLLIDGETVLLVVEGTPAPRGPRRLPPLSADNPIPDLRIGPLDLAQTARYTAASLDDNPLHRDAGAAQAIGLDRPIVHGMLVLGQFERAVAAWRDDLQIHRLFGAFIEPLPIDSRIVIGSRLVLSRRVGGVEELVLRMAARTEDDVAICVGEVEARDRS